MAADPLSNNLRPNQFADAALHRGPSQKALKPVLKIELRKDSRTEDLWRHEFLVFTVPDKGRELYLYFERILIDDVEKKKDKLAFALRLFGGNAYDSLTFHEAGSAKDVETKAYTKALFEIKLGPSAFTLKDLAKILEHESYENKYPRYGLFSANCWSWSRGLLLDIILRPHAATAEIWKTNGKDLVSITLKEMKLYLLTEYGAYGRLLLHFTSKDYLAQSRAFPDFLNPYAIRVILLSYSVLYSLVQFKRMIIGPSNWTTCLRKLYMYHDRTLDTSTNGQDCTFLPSHPNFTDLVPVLPGHMDYPIPSSFCQPGRYLYLLTSPIYTTSQPISSVHIHAFGATSNLSDDNGEENPSQDSTSWLSCGIIRRSEGDGELIEVPTSHVRLIAAPRGVTESRSPAEYSSIHVFCSDDFTREIRYGDMIALWAHSYPGRLHAFRSASIKVVVARRPARMLDWILASLLLWEIRRSIYFGGSYTSLAFSMIGYLFYWTNTFCEEWLWATLSAFARAMHASATPLSLPPHPTSVVAYSLPAFIQERSSDAETITSDILSASLRSVELLREKSGKEIVFISLSHRNVEYIIHIIVLSAVHAGWLHYLSFLSTPHRLEHDEVRIFRDGDTERTIHGSFAGQSILRIQFSADTTAAEQATEFEPRLRSIVKLLQGVQKQYWWYFWLNSRYWTWQWWLLHTVFRETVGIQECIAVEGSLCSYDGAATLLKDKHRQWRYAYMKEYGMCSIASPKYFG